MRRGKSGWYVCGCILIVVLLLCACGNAETPGGMLNSSDSFYAETELIGEVSPIDGFRIMQGGCVTDKYAWFVMVSEDNFDDYAKCESYIVQYDRLTMTEIARSEKLLLGHANDMTYHPENNELYVIHCYRRLVSVLDADSMTVKEIITTEEFNGYAVAYQPSRGQYVMGYALAGMIFYDEEWSVCGAALGLDTTLVTQGICADDRYVYHVLYSAKSNTEEPENMIFVMDWEGNLVTKVPIGLKGCEPENISLVGDTFYIGCNNSDWTGGLVYRAKLVKAEE